MDTPDSLDPGSSLTSIAVLYQISSELSHVEDEAAACNIFVTSTCKNFAIDLGILLELDAADGSYRVVTNMGLSHEQADQLSGEVAGTVFEKVLQENHPLRLASPPVGMLPDTLEHFSIRSVLLVPIASRHGSSYVFLGCRMYDREFLFEEERIISILAAKLATTLEGIIVQKNLVATEKQLEAQVQEVQSLNLALAHEKAEVEAQVLERTQQLTEEQAKLRASIEGLILGFVLIDRYDKIVIQNKVLQTIFGASEPFTTMHQLEEKLEGFDLAAARKTIQANSQPVEVKEVSLGAKILQLQLSPVKVTSGGQVTVIGTVIVAEDITEAKVMARSKDEFFSIASHELRTPLTAILGNASMIIDYHTDALRDPDMKEMIYDIHTASERLIGIVNDFMDVSGLEQGKVVFKPEEFTLGTIVETVVYEMRAILEGKHLSLDVEPKTLGTLPPIWADQGRTKQILYNLVSNALKYTEKGGASIHISTEGDSMKIVVSDTGSGISVENQKLLFHKLQQAGDSLLTRDTTRGTGLGLYISKILAERMGGTIALESSEPGKGSIFSVTLPLASAAREQAPTDSTAHTDTATGLST